jgi:hypothetical protein
VPDFGDGSPREQYGELDQHAPSVANGGITPEQWAEYQSKRRRDMILGILGIAGGTIGLGAAGAAFGGAGAAAGAAASGGGAGAAGGLAPIAGASPWAVTPYAGSATMVGTGLGAGAGAAGAAGAGTGAAGLFGGMSARDLAGLGVGLAGTVGGAMSNPPNLNPTTQTSDPNLQALMRTMQGRLDKSEPLYDSVLNMANGLLPTQYQKGGGGMG